MHLPRVLTIPLRGGILGATNTAKGGRGMRYGIICSMPEELEGILAELAQPTKQVAYGMEFYQGTLGGTELVCTLCGIGKVNAALGAAILIERFKPDAVVNSGVAGGIAPGLKPLDVVVAQSFCQHDIDTTALGDPLGLISTINVTYLPTDTALSARLEKAGEAAGIHTLAGVVASGDQFVADDTRKAFIRKTFNAVAVEMEGGAVAQICYRMGVPFAAIRSISDCEGAAMDYTMFKPIACEHATFVLLNALRGR